MKGANLWTVLAGASVGAIIAATGSASAQTPSATSVAETADNGTEVIVTARRRDELLQDVPQSIAVVTGEELNKYALKSFEDIDQVVPGMDLAPSTQGSLALTTFRGAGYSAQTSATNVVAFYANDAPVEANQIMQTTFDLGQVEVLRGTQGTLRGQSAPSGAITATLRRPNLSEFGGYINSTFQDDGDINLQGAVNVPVIHDVLGLRVAGVTDQNDVNGVKSINNGLDPKSTTDGFRSTLSFEPTENFHANLMYQRLRRTARSFGQVVGGPGSFGDPAISSEDRLSVQDDPNLLDLKSELVTANADWDIGPATLSFVGSWSDNRNRSNTDSDVGDTTPPPDGHQAVDTTSETKTEELRLTSNAPVFGLMDYTFGAFFSHADIETIVHTSGISLASNSSQEERSLYGNLDFHLGSKTDLAIGGRYLEQDGDTFQPAFSIVPEVNDHPRVTRTLWTAVLNHHFTDDLMGYVSAGTAARFTTPGILRLSFIGSDFTGPSAELTTYTNLPPEYSTNYEIGLKGEFLHRRLLTNVALFHQKFDNFIFLDQDIAYFNDGPFAPFVGGLHAATFTVAAPALIDGVDFDATYRVLPNWTVSASISYADAHLDNATVPCNAGTPDVNDVVKTCTSSGPISTVPNWSLTLQSEYDHPISDSTEAFLRGFVNYAPENKNGGNPNFAADAYSLVNSFAGLRSPNGAWEMSLFAKNAFDQKTELSRSVNPASAGSAYFNTAFTPPRVFGVSLSYALGSF